MAFTVSAKVTTERISGTVAGRYEEYVVDVYYQYDSDREKLSIEDVRRSVWFYESYGSLVIHATVSSIQLIRYDITPSGGWYWNSRLTDKARKSWYPGTATNRHVLYCGSEHCDSLSVRFVQQDHVWIELGMPVCTNDGTYYFGVSRMDEDREESDDKTARLCDYQQKTPCRWEDAGSCDYKYAGDLNSRATKVKAKLIDEENTKVPAYSERWMGETIRGSVAGETASTNFTIVSVNVKLDGTDEGNEESVGAMMGMNMPVKVTFEVHPKALPDCLDEFSVTCSDLYEKLTGKAYESASSAEKKKFRVIKKGTKVEYYRKFDTTRRYAAEKLKNLYVICQSASASYKDGVVRIEHPASGAKDLAKYTSVVVNVEITDFPTKKLLGEDKEEMPGAFIPYAADWEYRETPSDDESIPFGLSAQEKLVEVFVSYEPSDLPEDEDGGKILEFEAPPDSLYLPGQSGGADLRWIEFVDWWNTRPASQRLSFEGKKRLLLHGHEKSKSPRDRQIRVTHPKSGATDVAKYTVYHVDLDIDSDNDLAIEDEDGFEDAIEEREPGKIISYDQSGICPGQDYRVPLNLKAWGGETNAVVKLEAVALSPRVAEIYKSETGGTKVDLPAYFPADSIPALYVDGVTNGTVSFTATLINPPKEVPATTTVRPVPGDKLVKDTVATLIIQPISFAPGQGRHAGAWISDPCMDQPNNPNRSTLTANRIKSVAKSIGFSCAEHEEWCMDPTDGYDDDPGDLTLARFKAMANCGLLIFKGHGSLGSNIPVMFTNTQQGEAAANAWCVGEAGMASDRCRLAYGTFRCVRCNSSWYAANWKSGLDQGNAIVFWQSCHSAEGSGSSDSIVQSAGGRWRIAWGPSINSSGTVDDLESASVVQGTLEIMAKEPSARLAELAIRAGRAFMYGNCRTMGNSWTTLCPGPISDGGCFPKGALKKREPALGCMILDTFLDDTWSPEELLKAGDVAPAEAGIAPVWLRQEGCKHPYGVRFEICKESDKAVEVTVTHQRVRNWGVNCKDVPFMKNGFEGVDDMVWEMSAPGRALDADGSAPNDSDLKWRY